ncbi:MAG: hypothetical protein KF873_05600 [Gemmataceae bacterium]|nr:hypothetical protein [Gemmataceae bacterium]
MAKINRKMKNSGSMMGAKSHSHHEIGDSSPSRRTNGIRMPLLPPKQIMQAGYVGKDKFADVARIS